jgi:hypothetical protein
MWGPIGLILSTPITLCLVVMGRHVKSLEFVDIALGDRPPLTPAETFYQRLLAGNREEALETAEAALAGQSRRGGRCHARAAPRAAGRAGAPRAVCDGGA